MALCALGSGSILSSVFGAGSLLSITKDRLYEGIWLPEQIERESSKNALEDNPPKLVGVEPSKPIDRIAISSAAVLSSNPDPSLHRFEGLNPIRRQCFFL